MKPASPWPPRFLAHLESQFPVFSDRGCGTGAAECDLISAGVRMGCDLPMQKPARNPARAITPYATNRKGSILGEAGGANDSC
jgi:hypothetical protein